MSQWDKLLSTREVCCEAECMMVWTLLILCMTKQNHVRVWNDLFYKENLEWIWCVSMLLWVWEYSFKSKNGQVQIPERQVKKKKSTSMSLISNISGLKLRVCNNSISVINCQWNHVLIIRSSQVIFLQICDFNPLTI